MHILPFSKNFEHPLKNLCRVRQERYRFESQIPQFPNTSRGTYGFVAINEERKLMGFMAINIRGEHGYLFGLRVHPSFSIQGVGGALLKHISNYALKHGCALLRSAYLIDNSKYEEVIVAEGWMRIGSYILTRTEPPFQKYEERLKTTFAKYSEKSEVEAYIHSTTTGKSWYEKLFLKDSVWYPIKDASRVLDKFYGKSRVVISRNDFGSIAAAALINLDTDKKKIIISYLWGNIESCLAFIIKHFRPHSIEWYVLDEAGTDYRILGFSTIMRFLPATERIYESRFALIEKRLS